MRSGWRHLREAFIAMSIALPCPALADTALVAVATNFMTVAEDLVETFERTSAHDITLVSGSTGKFYTQIVRGAPFDIFLSADEARPARLVAEGRAAERRPYAIGRLVLWSRAGEPSEARLRSVPQLAIANPALAPYGVAAMETLAYYGRTGDREPALVMGENAGQAVAMVATGNVEYGLLPLSVTTGGLTGRAWPVPEEAHAPIRQDAVLLDGDNSAAAAFLTFLGSDEAASIIEAGGYAVPDPVPER